MAAAAASRFRLHAEGGAAVLLAMLVLCAPARAQEPAEVPAAPGAAEEAGPVSGAVTGAGGAVAEPLASPVLTLNQERLFRGSAYGRAVLARAEAETAALATENRRIEAALEAEERSLTDRRKAMAPEAFAPLAAEFDARVEDIRAAQAAKSRDITDRLDRDRQAFFEAAVPILGELMREAGAVVILSDQTIILSLSSLDVTERAILRLDERLPLPDDAEAQGVTAPAAPAPEAPAAAP